MAIPIRSRAARQGDSWSPFDEFDRALNRVLGDLYPTRAEYPPVNIWMGRDDIVLTAELQVILPKSKKAQPHQITIKAG